ncbi:TIR domain-containing protein [Promethearchaeum syntrophicum]|uniref:TIR domain-containing protein n=1 Tax=Promethearchaeum syntrophicum TaxID=2594042 RepID=A0A5B9DCR3_9ARCH|nr:TIR domain-containing protein [Candidatus Prometheoarchaeum syntrophicum]QEE16831.1 hypothetical protein DSAG12_02661 [Candidatus Prometheoarchaeum syntrophicum]
MRVVFFSFHYQRDIWRARYIKSSWYYAETREAAGFWDGSIEENHPTFNDQEIKKLINQTLHGTSVTVVLIGQETSYRRWIKYEIKQSYLKNNALLGIYIHKLRNKYRKRDTKGNNPFEYVYDDYNQPLSDHVPIYDWFDDKGKYNIGSWIEEAARDVGR